LKRGDEKSKGRGKRKNGGWNVVKGSEVKWSEVKWSEVKWSEDLCEMGVLPLIYSYVAVFMFCAVRCVITICWCLLFSNYSTRVF